MKVSQFVSYLTVALALAGCGDNNPVVCGNISARECADVVAPGIRAGVGKDFDKYDLGNMWFADFGCDKVSPLEPRRGERVDRVFVFYDACQRRVKINRGPIL